MQTPQLVAPAAGSPVESVHAPFSTHTSRLSGIARRIVGSGDLAEDALQEARISLWLSGAQPPNLEAWLVRTVVNRSLHARRSAMRRRNHETCACALRRYERAPESPCRALERQEEHDLVHRALDALEEPLRNVLVLREIEGRDYASIASTLGIPVGTVRSRLSRARAALRGQVEGLAAR